VLFIEFLVYVIIYLMSFCPKVARCLNFIQLKKNIIKIKRKRKNKLLNIRFILYAHINLCLLLHVTWVQPRDAFGF
jgi:hypothetical protein